MLVKTMEQNPENRDNARIDYKSPIQIEDLRAGIMCKAKMLNYSKNGLYFETDTLLHPGKEIYVGIEYSPYIDSTDTYECYRAKVVWRKKLPTSRFTYGYGIKYMIDHKKQDSLNYGSNKSKDLRKYHRKPYTKSIFFAAQNRLFKGLTKDISPSGVFIEANTTFDVGQALTLVIPLKKAKSAKVKGKVVWSMQEGFGVKFFDIKK